MNYVAAQGAPNSDVRRVQENPAAFVRAFVAMREALSDLMDVQNGSPLPKYDAAWAKAMADGDAALKLADAAEVG